VSGVKAMIDALNVIYEREETRGFIKLNLPALVFTLAGFAAFLLAIASIIVLPLVFSPFGLGSLSETLARVARCPPQASPTTRSQIQSDTDWH
jgi:membrane protein